jgi:hypothetical protein
MNPDLIISFVHVLVTGPYLIYLGLYKPKSIYYYILLFILALVIIGAFIYKYVTKKLYAWLFVHLFLFVTLFLTVSILRFMNKEIPYYLYSFLLAIGIAAVGYHIIKIYKSLK